MGSPSTRSYTALGVLAAAVVAYPFVPLSGDTWKVYYDVVAIGAILIAVLSVRRHCPRRRGAWLLLVGGFGIWVVGDLLATVEQTVWHLTSYPVPSDAVYLGAYGLLAAGCLVMVRSRGAGRDMTALLDATIIAAGAAVVAAVFLIVPSAADSELTGFGKVISSAYPLADVMLIAVIVRMWTAPGARSASYRLLVSALSMTLTADVIWNVLAMAVPGQLCPRRVCCLRAVHDDADRAGTRAGWAGVRTPPTGRPGDGPHAARRHPPDQWRTRQRGPLADHRSGSAADLGTGAGTDVGDPAHRGGTGRAAGRSRASGRTDRGAKSPHLGP
jgi:hypothetical protein